MNELHQVWFGYFWPSLQGNGPEDLLSYLIIGGGVTWLGRWALREWRGHKAHVHAQVTHSHALLNHIIEHHPDIPSFEEEPMEPEPRQAS